MMEYEVGKWIGWNGGECPVHPETVVEWVNSAGTRCSARAGGIYFNNPSQPVIAFRVITPHVEPETYNGECWAYHYTSMAPTTAHFNVGEESQHGKWTAIHENGKLKSFTWSADE